MHDAEMSAHSEARSFSCTRGESAMGVARRLFAALVFILKNFQPESLRVIKGGRFGTEVAVDSE